MGTRQRTNAERRRKANAKNHRNLLEKIGKGNFKGFPKEKTFKSVKDYFEAKIIQSAEQNAAIAAEYALMKAEKNKNRPGRLLRKKSDRIAAQTRVIALTAKAPTGVPVKLNKHGQFLSSNTEKIKRPRKLKKQLSKQAA